MVKSPVKMVAAELEGAPLSQVPVVLLNPNPELQVHENGAVVLAGEELSMQVEQLEAPVPLQVAHEASQAVHFPPTVTLMPETASRKNLLEQVWQIPAVLQVAHPVGQATQLRLLRSCLNPLMHDPLAHEVELPQSEHPAWQARHCLVVEAVVL
jgi:hypothetical protein